MAEVVAFRASDEDRARVVGLLEEALVEARLGRVIDVAIVLAVRDEDGPQFWLKYWGRRAYSTLVTGVSALAFDLHYQRVVGGD